MPVFRSVNYEHFDSWEPILLENRKEIEENCSLSKIDFMKSLNLPYTIWEKKYGVNEFHISVFNNVVTLEYTLNRKVSMTMPYTDFLMFFVEN